ncbi:MAG: hypothetical protein ACI9J3_002358 [Parvicellaceae bacterium]|jgi:hypothetical protein
MILVLLGVVFFSCSNANTREITVVEHVFSLIDTKDADGFDSMKSAEDGADAY